MSRHVKTCQDSLPCSKSITSLLCHCNGIWETTRQNSTTDFSPSNRPARTFNLSDSSI